MWDCCGAVRWRGRGGARRIRAGREGVPGWRAGADRLFARGGRRRAAGVGGTVWLREVDAAAAARGSRGTHQRDDPHRRPRRRRRVTAGAQRRDGIPGLRAVPAHDGARKPRVPAAHEEDGARRDRGARREDGGPARTRRTARAVAAPALGRPAPARRDGSRAGARTRPLSCSTNRSRISTPSCAARCAPRSRHCSGAPARRCST